MKKMRIQPTAPIYLLIVLMALFGLVFLTGATNGQQVDRYRMQVIVRGNFTDIYVIDTATGVIKWVGDDQGKPFDAIKSK